MRRVLAFFVVLISLALLAAAGGLYYVQMQDWHTELYAASTTNTVAVYSLGEDGSLTESKRIVRGTRISRYSTTLELDGEEYCLVRTDDQLNPDDAPRLPEISDISFEEVRDFAKYYALMIIDALEDLIRTKIQKETTEGLYMKTAELTEDIEDVVRETELYVRTPVTIYKDAQGPGISYFAPKGSRLDVIGYDSMDEQGFINKYKVAYQHGDKTSEGYVYSKYLVATQEEADEVYNEYGEYDAASGDKFGYELYGGNAADLDYFPYERTAIEGNEFCSYARTMYLNGVASVDPSAYIKIINKTDCNAVVMDIKDGYLAYQSEVAKEWSPTAYRTAYASVEKYREGVEKLRETGVYLIGRIVVFNDPQYAKDHPEDCIKYKGSTSWPSGYSRDVWEYNVRLAQEAVREFGFNEIQFDYVRFPEATYEMSKSGKANFRNRHKEDKAQAIQNFCFYAADQLREVGAYVSVDVFGESAYSYVTAYGQYWMAIANIVDAISAMPYTDHLGGSKAWEDPYGSVLKWARRAAKQQKRLQEPAAARTWITGYNTPYWAPTVNYNTKELKDQIRALEKAGLKGGFIPWNALSDVDKYNKYKGIWKE